MKNQENSNIKEAYAVMEWNWRKRCMNKFFICATSPCMERMLDSQKIFLYLKANSWNPSSNISTADLVIISTCAFGNYEDRCCVELIKHYAAQKKKSARVIIVGCLPVINPSKLAEICNFPTVSPINLDKLDEILKSRVKFRDITEPNKILASEVSYQPLLKKILNVKSSLAGLFAQGKFKKNFFKTQLIAIRRIINFIIFAKSYINPFLVYNRSRLFYIRISKGCMGNCSYCAKRFATGRLKSKPPEQILNEFKKGLSLKEKRFLLLTEDAGCYGLDIGTTILKLLGEIFEVGKNYDFKLIISNFNAEWFLKYYDELEGIIVNNQEKILYFHIPIQSGSNRILQLMNRPYQIEDVERCLCRLRNKIPTLNLSTDIMVGFPGEAEDDLNLTKQFLKKIKFNFADIFCYENRPNTPASKLDWKLSQEIIEERKSSLLKIQNKNANVTTIAKKIPGVVRDFIYVNKGGRS
jgi:tRNA A37 methylthiotransferase MiaB